LKRLVSRDCNLLLDILASLNIPLQEQAGPIPKCLICFDFYRNPLTSINCWHVHCESKSYFCFSAFHT
ncbi:hypothetical protein BDR26DRAFT_849474, partial [Obelidium mucronatum]